MLRITSPEKLKEIRGELTQKELSELTKISLSKIKRLEAGSLELTKKDENLYKRHFSLSDKDLYDFKKRDTVIVTVNSIKGGVGKTSVSANLGYSLALKGHKVLLVDSDSQMNLTQHLGIFKKVEGDEESEEFIDEEKNLYSSFVGSLPLLDVIKKTGRENLDIIVADPQLSFMDIELSVKAFAMEKFSKMIDDLKDEGIYDVILFDTFINLANFNTSILKKSQLVIIPVVASNFGIYGMERLLKHIEEIEKFLPKGAKIVKRIILNQVDERKKITKDVSYFLEKLYPDLVLKSEIKTDSNIDQAQWRNQLLGEYKPTSRAQKDYEKLASEIYDEIKIIRQKGSDI